MARITHAARSSRISRKRPPAPQDNPSSGTGRPRGEKTTSREIRAHLELEAEERIADGDPPAEAHYAARRAFGNVTLIREDARAVWIAPWLDHTGAGPPLCCPAADTHARICGVGHPHPRRWHRSESHVLSPAERHGPPAAAGGRSRHPGRGSIVSAGDSAPMAFRIRQPSSFGSTTPCCPPF